MLKGRETFWPGLRTGETVCRLPRRKTESDRAAEYQPAV